MSDEKRKCRHTWADLIACNKVQIGAAPHLTWCTKCGIDRGDKGSAEMTVIESRESKEPL